MQETIHEIIIDEEFRILLPELDGETFRLLEESILEHGCRDPLVLWNGILIDGYNRYRICKHHSIPFSTVEMEFDTREAALIWIITNQVSRRNLTPTQLSHFRGLHYNADKNLRGDINRFSYVNLGIKSGENALNSPKAQNGPLQTGSTASRLAEHYNVARNTIKRDAKLADGLTSIGNISPETKRKILNGEVRIGKSRLEALSAATPEEVEALVQEIEEGTFVSRTPRATQGSTQGDGSPVLPPKNTGEPSPCVTILPEIRQLNAIISDFASNFNSVLGDISSGDTASLKDVVRAYISQLEDWLRQETQ
jgi:ParB-like chromosome segregation protein Spo0J